MDRQLQNRIAQGAQITADTAKALAAAFSKRIPGAIFVQKSSQGANVVSDGTMAPSGLPNEFGVRHPVFGHRDRWSRMPTRPYMEVAEARTLDQVTNAAAGWLDDITKEAGFK